MSKRKYRVDLQGLEKKNFSLGGGRHLTLLDGAVLSGSHDFIKLFPTFVKEVTDVAVGEKQLLVEEPIEVAKVETIVDTVNEFKNKASLVKYAQEVHEISLSKTENLDKMKKTLLSKIEG